MSGHEREITTEGPVATWRMCRLCRSVVYTMNDTEEAQAPGTLVSTRRGKEWKPADSRNPLSLTCEEVQAHEVIES